MIYDVVEHALVRGRSQTGGSGAGNNSLRCNLRGSTSRADAGSKGYVDAAGDAWSQLSQRDGIVGDELS